MLGLDAAAVLPLPPPHDAAAGDDVVYDIVASIALPIVDISRSIRSVLFSTAVVKRFDRAVARSRLLLFLVSGVAITMAAALPLFDVAVGRYLTVPVFLMSVPGPIVQAMYMRFEIVLLLVRTYDFWFFTLTWLVSMALFTVCLADMRGLATFGMWFGLQTNIMVDATVSTREIVWLNSLGLVVSVLVIGFIVIDGFQGMGDFDVFVVNGYVVSAQMVVISGWSTCLLVLARNLYRRREAIRDHGKHNATVVQCLSYRCRVRLRAREKRRRSANSLSSLTSGISSIGSSHMTRPTASYFENAKMVQMRCMRVKFKIRARDLVAPFATRLLENAASETAIRIVRAVLLLLLQAGVISTSVSFIPGVPTGCRYASLATTALFCTLSLAMQHRQLLKYVAFSFDFAFLSFQLTVMHLALCDLYAWDSRAFPIVSVWLWFHWVLTFDCIPPVLKARMRFRHRFVVLIAVQFVVAHVGLLYQLMALDRHTFRDRAILRMKIHKAEIEVRVLPLLVSRMFMTFCWSCRIVARLLYRNENELVIVQGTVTYINNRRKIKQREAEFLAARPLSTAKIFKVTRQMTRRLSAFVGVAQSSVSVTVEPLKSDPMSAQAMSPLRNARLVNIAGQVYDASRVIVPLQQQRLSALAARDGGVVNSGPMLFHVVGNPQGKQTVELNGAKLKITPLDTSARSTQRQGPDDSEVPERGSGEDTEAETTEAPRFII